MPKILKIPCSLKPSHHQHQHQTNDTNTTKPTRKSASSRERKREGRRLSFFFFFLTMLFELAGCLLDDGGHDLLHGTDDALALVDRTPRRHDLPEHYPCSLSPFVSRPARCRCLPCRLLSFCPFALDFFSFFSSFLFCWRRKPTDTKTRRAGRHPPLLQVSIQAMAFAVRPLLKISANEAVPSSSPRS